MLDTAFVCWGVSVTWLEVAAFMLALGCVVFNVYEIHWGWPLAIGSSVLYAWLFASARVYGDAGLQVFFAATAAWGWWQWLFGRRRIEGSAAPAQPLRVTTLDARARVRVLVFWLAGWLSLGLMLSRFTDSDVPWLDAFPTAGSVIAQILLARKYVDTWWVWLGVNVGSVALFGYKDLWLTALLYLIFIGLSVQGLMRWRRQLEQQSRMSSASAESIA
jgi:nicotinamide mononucleotide transporter